jgi:streptogramin lyase/ribosomal protein L7/L12
MAEAFKCPSCGAPLDFHPGDAPVIHCPFCNTSVIVPTQIRDKNGTDAGAVVTPAADGADIPYASSFENPAAPQAEQMQVILELARQGQRVEAIKRLRAITNLELHEASAVVDKMAAGQAVQLGWTDTSVSSQVEGGSRNARMQEILALIRQGNQEEAVSRFRQYFGGSLGDARKAVQMIASALPHAAPIQMPGDAVEMIASTLPHGVASQMPGDAVIARPGRSGPKIGLMVALVTFFLICVAVGIGAYLISKSGGTMTQALAPIIGTESADSLTPTEVPTPTPGFATRVLRFGGEGIGPGQFQDARSIAVDGEGRIYVAEYSGGRVQVFDPQGKFIAQWLVDAKMPLRAMAVSRQGVVTIIQHGILQRYNGLTGEKLDKVAYPGGDYFDDVVMTPDGGLVGAFMHLSDNIVRLDAKDHQTLMIKNAISAQTDDSELDMRIAVDGLGNIYALGSFNEAVFKFSAVGKFLNKIGGSGAEPGLFSAVGAIAVDGHGRIYVSDTKGIQVFDTNGRYLDVFEVSDGYPSGLAFNDQGELLVAARTDVLKYAINR